MKYGEERSKHRQLAEQLKREGWSFFQLIGPYRGFASHSAAFAYFSEAVENQAGQAFGRSQVALPQSTSE
jgi:hypothetical protein